jgi:hypothetical protein
VKKLLLLLTLAVAIPVSAQTNHPALKIAFAQTTTGHSATVTWTAPSTPGASVTISRCAGTSCTVTTAFTQLATNVAAAGPYVDTTITAGQYCYIGVLVVNGASSAPSNIVCGTLSPSPLTGFAVAIQ